MPDTSSSRWEHWQNPILIRSLRQALRSRAFLGLYLLALAVAGLAGFINALDHQDASSGNGRAMFLITVMAWTFAAWVVVPIQAFNAVVRERNEDTWDLVLLTGISPHRVVRGLIATALMQALAIGAALAPFLVLAYLLRGLDLGLLLLALILLPVITMGLAASAVFLGCLGHHRVLRTTLGTLMGLGLFCMWISSTTFWGMSADSLARELASSWRPWWGLAAFVDIIGSATIVLMLLAAARLTHPAQDRSTPLRLAWLAMWMNGAAIVAALVSDSSMSLRNLVDMACAFCVCGVVWFLPLGLFAVTEADKLTQRQLQSLHFGPRWLRAVKHVFGPGARRGRRTALLTLTLALLPGLLALPWLSDTGRDASPIRGCLAVVCYALALFGLWEPLVRWCGSRWFTTAARRRALLVAVAALWISLPACFAAVASIDQHGFFMGLSPLAVAALTDTWTAWNTPVGWMAIMLGLAGTGRLMWMARPRRDDEHTLSVDQAPE